MESQQQSAADPFCITPHEAPYVLQQKLIICSVLLQEAEQKEREERRRRIEEHTCQVAEAERRRKQRTKMLRKRTDQGQPVMRYRMDKILDQLQAEAGQL